MLLCAKTRCMLKNLPGKAMSCWEVQEGKESPQSHHNYDTKPLGGDPEMPAGTSLTKITSELSMFNWQPGGNWADVPIWHQLHIHQQPLPTEICLIGTGTASCSAGVLIAQVQPVHCGQWLWKTHHKAHFQKLGVWFRADRTSFFRTFSLWKAVLLKLNSGSKFISVK